MSVTMLGNTVVNITITSYLEELIVSMGAGRLVKKVLQISKVYYPITKSCSSSVFLNLVNAITIHSAVQLGNCPQLLPPSFYPQFPINLLLVSFDSFRKVSFDSPSEKYDTY